MKVRCSALCKRITFIYM